VTPTQRPSRDIEALAASAACVLIALLLSIFVSTLWAIALALSVGIVWWLVSALSVAKDPDSGCWEKERQLRDN
jgi:hypothetical protein